MIAHLLERSRGRAALCWLLVACTSSHAAFPAPATADWPPEGVQLSPNLRIAVGADARGGIFAADGHDLLPRLHHLDANGERGPEWPFEGVELTPGVSPLEHASIRPFAILPDGTGGMFVLTRQKSPYQGSGGFWYPDQYFVHRRTERGEVTPGWPREGVRLERHYMEPRYVGLHPPRMVPDGSGGVLVAWLGVAQEWLGSLPSWPNPRVVVQRVTATGARIWGEDGVTVREARGACTIPAIVADGNGGALVFWGQWNPAGTRIRIHGQHVAESGDAMWAVDGMAVSTGAFDRVPESVPADGGWIWASYHTAIAAVSDGESGAILAWAGATGADLNIFATRVAPDGALPWHGDLAVCTASGEQATVEATEWHPGGAVIAWRDGREGADVGIFVQGIDKHGRSRWDADGAPIAVGTGERGPVRVVSDGRQGNYLVWGDPTGGGRVYGMRLLHSGRPAPGWAPNGELVSRVAEPDYGASISLDLVDGGNGTAIAAWTSWRRGSFAMLLTPHGVVTTERRVEQRPPSRPLDRDAVAMHPELSISGVEPQPVTAGGFIRLTLSGSGPARLAVFDLAGRSVWTFDIGGMGSGEHRVPFAPAAHLPDGVYLMRLTQGDRVVTSRVIILR